MQNVHLVRYSDELGNKDYATFVLCVEQFFATANHSLPIDIRRWLNLIAEGVNGNEYLIRYNIALMEPVQAFQFLMTGKQILEGLRNVSTTNWLYQLIVSWHPKLSHWMNRDCKNLLLLETQRYIRAQVAAHLLQIDPDLRGVLKLWRDTRHHSARWYEAFMLLIIEEDFPGEAAKFQRSLSDAGLLGRFHLEATMG